MKNAFLIMDTHDLAHFDPCPRAICTTVKGLVSVMTDLANEKIGKGYMFYTIFQRDGNASDTVKKSNSQWWSFYDKELEEVIAMGDGERVTEDVMRKFLRKHNKIN